LLILGSEKRRRHLAAN